ncbi:MAG TPA: hypothetical protein VK152_00305 [Paludibacter sp.]|nr:hypothetical protein [Paludibacter sp.]
MTNSPTAIATPLQKIPTRNLQIHRPRPQKPRKQVFHNLSNEFEPETAREILNGFMPELQNLITKPTVVTCKTDESGVNMVLSCPDFQISVIYTDLNGGSES